MDKQEQIDLIAEKVMGWLSNQKAYFNEQNQYIMSKSKYDPLTNISQAIEALEKYCRDNKRAYIIYKSLGNLYTRAILVDTTDLIVGLKNTDDGYESLTTVICECLIEAIGGTNAK